MLPGLMGDWVWRCASGGIAGATHCATESSPPVIWGFGTDSIFRFTRADTLVRSARFSVRREAGGLTPDSVNLLYLDGEPTIYAMATPADTILAVQEQCYDCFRHTFVRGR